MKKPAKGVADSGNDTFAYNSDHTYEYSHSRDWYNTVHYANFPETADMGKCIPLSEWENNGSGERNAHWRMWHEFSQRMNIDKNAPYMLYFMNCRLEEIENLTHNKKEIAELNKKGIHILLYEPMCSYDSRKIPDWAQEEYEQWLWENHPIEYDKLVENYRNPIILCNFGFYSEFQNGTINPKRYRSHELDSILRYSTRNGLTNIHVWTGDYAVNDHYVYYKSQLHLHCEDIFLYTFSYKEATLPNCAKFPGEITKHFISTNWRYTTSRAITASILSNKQTNLSWPFSFEQDLLDRLPWMNLKRELFKYYPEVYKAIIMGVLNLNKLAPVSLDLVFTRKEPVLEANGHTYPHACEEVDSTDNPVSINRKKYPLEPYYNQSFVDIVNESRFAQPTANISEKTFQAIQYWTPFVVVAPPHSLQYMHEMGFKTFSDYWDESYDTETDHCRRLIKIIQLIEQISEYSIKECNDLYTEMIPTLEHNYINMLKISRSGGIEPILRTWTDSSIGLF